MSHEREWITMTANCFNVSIRRNLVELKTYHPLHGTQILVNLDLETSTTLRITKQASFYLVERNEVHQYTEDEYHATQLPETKWITICKIPISKDK